LEAFNTHLCSVSYVDGWTPSNTDVDIFGKFKAAPSAKEYPHIARWYAHINSFAKEERAKWVASTSTHAPMGSCKAPASPTKAAPAKDDEEDIDLFGEDDEDDEEKERIKTERVAAYAAAKAGKKQVIAKSNVIFDVKPWDDETDLLALEKMVREIKMDGLVWGSSKLMPVAFGIKKLQIGCALEDDKVSTDVLEEMITAFEDYVQSVDIAAFQKI